jgi:hypothetical protein
MVVLAGGQINHLEPKTRSLDVIVLEHRPRWNLVSEFGVPLMALCLPHWITGTPVIVAKLEANLSPSVSWDSFVTGSFHAASDPHRDFRSMMLRGFQGELTNLLHRREVSNEVIKWDRLGHRSPSGQRCAMDRAEHPPACRKGLADWSVTCSL